MANESKLTFTDEKYTIEHAKNVFGVEEIDIRKFKSGLHGFACGRLSGAVSSKVNWDKDLQIVIAKDAEGVVIPILCNLGYEFEVVRTL